MLISITSKSAFVGSLPSKKSVGQGRSAICLDVVLTGDQSSIEHLLISPDFESVGHYVTFPRCIDVGRIYNLVDSNSLRSLVAVQKDC